MNSNNQLYALSDIQELSVDKYQSLLDSDIYSDHFVKELITIMFNKPDGHFYIYSESGTKPNEYLMRAIKKGLILVKEVSNFYYRHPKNSRQFVNIFNKNNYEFEWERACVEKGPRFERTRIELSESLKRQLETIYKIELEKKLDNFPLELKPNFMGFGLDLMKIPSYFKYCIYNKIKYLYEIMKNKLGQWKQ